MIEPKFSLKDNFLTQLTHFCRIFFVPMSQVIVLLIKRASPPQTFYFSPMYNPILGDNLVLWEKTAS